MPEEIVACARKVLTEGYLERSSLLFELALEAGGRFDRSELLDALSALGDVHRATTWATRVSSDPRVTSNERAAAANALNPASEALSPEQLLAQGLEVEQTNLPAANRLFDRARIGFERRERGNASADLEFESVGDVYIAEDSQSFVVVNAAGYQSWNLAGRRPDHSVKLKFSANSPFGVSRNLRWFADATTLFDSQGNKRFSYEESDALAFSPDGGELYTVDQDQTRVWAVPSGTLLGKSKRRARAIAWCGKQMLVETGAAAELRDTFDGPTLRTFPHAHLGPGQSTCVGAGGIATSGLFDGLKFYARQTGRLLREFGGLVYISADEAWPPLAVPFTVSKDGSTLVWSAVANSDSAVIDTRTWRVLYGKAERSGLDTADDRDRGFPVVVSPDGRFLVEGVHGERLRIRSLPSAQVSWETQARAGDFSRVAESPDGRVIAALRRNFVLLYAPGTSKPSRLISVPFAEDFKWLSNGRLAVWAPGVLQVFDPSSAAVVQKITLDKLENDSSTRLLLTPSQFVISDLRGNSMFFFDQALSAAPREIKGQLATVSDSGDLYVSIASKDDRFEVHTRDGNLVRALSALAGETYSADVPRFTPNDRFLLRGTADAAVLWNIASDRVERRFVGATQLSKTAFSADGKELGTLSEDDTLRVFSMSTGALLRQFAATQDAGKDAAWLGRSGWRIRDRKLALWTTDGRAVLQIASDRDGFAGYLRAPDGRVESLDPTQPPPLCAIGTGRYPWQLCEGRLTAHDLFARTLRGDQLLAKGL